MESGINWTANLNDKFVKIDKKTLTKNKVNNSKSTGVLPSLERSSGIYASYADDIQIKKNKFADK